MRKLRTTLPCVVCGTDVERTPKKFGSTGVYCSRTCYWSAMRAKPDRERFWSKADKSGPVHPSLGTQCWVWTGAKTVGGYGVINTTNGRQYAHRFSWSLHAEGRAAGEVLCHSCDNPPCVRPDHLAPGTHADNVHDCIAKERDGTRTLTVADVLAIRAAYVPRRRGRGRGAANQYRLAEQYGVTQTTIGAILRRKTWKHV